MKTAVQTVLLFFALSISLSSCIAPAGREYSVAVANRTGEEITSILVSHESESNWNFNENRLYAGETLPDGEVLFIDGVYGRSPRFDIRLDSESGAYERYGLVLDGSFVIFSPENRVVEREPIEVGLYGEGSEDHYVVIANETGNTLYFVYGSHVSEDDWGDELLGDNVLPDGEQMRIDFHDYPSGYFNLLVIDSHGNAYENRELNLERYDWTVTRRDIIKE